jgi:threonine dehydratase
MMHSRVLSEVVGGPVYLKCQNLQRTGSFKVRGAYVRIARLSDAERARGVVAASVATTPRASRSRPACSAARRP